MELLHTSPYYTSSYQAYLIRNMDADFDSRRATVSTDIIAEWVLQKEAFPFFDYVFCQDNNDGRLLIDQTEEGKLFYAFLDGREDIHNAKIMDASSYLVWDSKEDKFEETEACKGNIKWISENASLMTKEMLMDFLDCQYAEEEEAMSPIAKLFHQEIASERRFFNVSFCGFPCHLRIGQDGEKLEIEMYKYYSGEAVQDKSTLLASHKMNHICLTEVIDGILQVIAAAVEKKP